MVSTSRDNPEWIQSLIDTPSERGETSVDGCRINYVTWGDIGKPGVVLLHGANAHLEWWRLIAPLLADQFRVVAMDSSGSGDSGWREQYTGEIYAREAMEVAQAAGLGKNPYIVGHSFGGFPTMEAGFHFGTQLGGIIVMDFTIPSPDMVDEFAEMRKKRRNEPIRPTRVYPDKESALARFRLMPEQPNRFPSFIGYLAEHSLRQVEGGWTWKFDPGRFQKMTMEQDGEPDRTNKLLGMKCPAAFVMAESSDDYSEDSIDYTRKITEGKVPLFSIPGTYHHLMFDEPIAVAMTIKSTVHAWEHR